MPDIRVKAKLTGGAINTKADLGRIVEIPVGPDVYTGEYEVIAPSTDYLVLPTKDKLMEDERIKKITLPNATWARRYSFGGENVSLLEELYLPSLLSLGNLPFQNNPNLRILDVGTLAVTSINGCTNLTTLILRRSNIFNPSGNFSGNPFAPNGIGGIVYVPQSLLEDYRASENWQSHANVLEFRPIEGSEYELEE